MRRLLLGGVTAGLLVLGAPMATAADSYTGACEVYSINGGDAAIAQEDEYIGEISGSFLATDDSSGAALPLAVTCWVEVDTVEAHGTRLAFSGTGEAAGAQEIHYYAYEGAQVEVCWDIDYGTSHDRDCVPVPVFANPVLGYIFVSQLGTSTPTYLATGVLADPTSWTCTDNGNVTPYEVTCLPVGGTWFCDVVNVAVLTSAPGAVGRATLDCDGGAPEAQTGVASGAWDYAYELAPDGAAVAAFTCTVDDGSGGASAGNLWAYCGDPGAPRVS